MPMTHQEEIKFCNKCERRIGPVSSTHAATGGTEAQCQCDLDIDKIPRSNDTIPNEHLVAGSTPARSEKTTSTSPSTPVDVSPQKKAAQAIRNWATNFSDLGIHTYPSCMKGISHMAPIDMLKALKLDRCCTRQAYIDVRVNEHKAKKVATCAWEARKKLIQCKHQAPLCFNPFAHGLATTDVDQDEEGGLSKDEIWTLLTEEQKLSLLVDEAMIKYDHYTERVRGKAERDWWEKCMRAVTGGARAFTDIARNTPSKKRLIDEHFARARTNINKKPKAEVDKITRSLFDDIEMAEWDADVIVLE